jgi:hypothetical protein
MSVSFVPLITPPLYPTFQEICGGRLPETHAEWSQTLERNHRDERYSGHEVVYVVIEPDAFRQYCAQKGCQPDNTALHNFAYENGRTQNS